MEIGVEISLYPLQEQYAPDIKDFIRRLQSKQALSEAEPLAKLRDSSKTTGGSTLRLVLRRAALRRGTLGKQGRRPLSRAGLSWSPPRPNASILGRFACKVVYNLHNDGC